jgi:hypothetical protein
MSRAGTQYSEKERLVTINQLSNYGLNPHAFMGLIESYIINCHPNPIKYVHYMTVPDSRMDAAGPTVGTIELYITAVGNLAKSKPADPELLDQTFLRMFLHSYYSYMRPLPVSFQFANSISIDIRTPGMAEDKKKNPMRDLFDPTK